MKNILLSLIPFFHITAYANFSAPETSGNFPLNITFAANYENAVSYCWSFGDGLHSNLKDPQHVYQKPGNYTVKLIITRKDGSKSVQVRGNYIKVKNQPISPFLSSTIK